MAERWAAFPLRLCEEVAGALEGCPQVELDCYDDALEMRECVEGASLVLVGQGEGGVSDINLAAAIVSDGCPCEVVLVSDEPTGSLRSRARRAGIAKVVQSEAVVGLVRLRLARMRVAGSQPSGEGTPEARQPRRGPAGRLARRPDDHAAPVLVVASARGGVGKTAISAAMAVVAQSWGMRVALVDLDLSTGNLFNAFGLPKGQDLAGLVEGRRGASLGVEASAVKAAEKVSLLGPCDLPEMAEVVFPFVGQLVDEASACSDLVIVDTSTTWTDGVAQAAQLCDRLLIVSNEGSESPGSVARLAALAVRLGIARTRIVRVSNFGDLRHAGAARINRADVGLETARLMRVADGGSGTSELLASGYAEQLSQLDSPFSSSVSSLLAQLLAELGRLPDDKAAKAALDRDWTKAKRGLFSRWMEAS